MSKLMYIAGKFTGDTPWETECNIRRAEGYLIMFARRGVFCICPHTQGRYLVGVADYEYWIAATLEAMRRCDGVLLLPGWLMSRGAIAERSEAERLGLKVFDLEDMNTRIDNIEHWALGGQ